MSGDYWDDPAVKKAEAEYEAKKAELARERADAARRAAIAKELERMQKHLAELKRQNLKRWEAQLEAHPTKELAERIEWARGRMQEHGGL